jgi:lipopolysaccharide assembly protein B
MIHDFWLLLLPIAAVSGWLAAANASSSKQDDHDETVKLPRDYLIGLKFLLDEEHDKALDAFIKMLKVDSETVETHLALGNLFRRRGEVNRAIRIHQNLIARPNLNKSYRAQALLALARDYLSAGVLDRAERLFSELIKTGEYKDTSLKYLLSIYEQENEFQKAIQTAEQLSKNALNEMKPIMAHYYCELAETSIQQNNIPQAIKQLKQAISMNENCVRANLLFAKTSLLNGHAQQAIRYLKQIENQNMIFFPEAILPLTQAHQTLEKGKDLVLYFKELLKKYPKLPVVVILSKQIQQWRGEKAAVNFVADYVRKYPSIQGLHHLAELEIPLTQGKAQTDLILLRDLTQKLLEEYPAYRCVSCGFSTKILLWQCPTCRKWETIQSTYMLDK